MNITDILIGRCLDLNTLKQDATTNCSQFINDLQSVWDNNIDKQIYTSDYDQYNLLENTDFSSPKDRSLFWSGVPKKVVDDYTNKGSRFTQLVETPGGALMSDLMWCGADAGRDYRCPKELNGWGDFEQTYGGFNGARNAWWQGASREFAKSAYGETHIFIYRSNTYTDGAFYGDSILSKVEIPHLNSEKITNVKILLAKELGFTGTESCESESILGLQWELRKRNFGKDQIECIDNPWQIEAMLCFDNLEDAVCKGYQSLDVLEKKIDDAEKELGVFQNLTISGWVLFSFVFLFLIWTLTKRGGESSEPAVDNDEEEQHNESEEAPPRQRNNNTPLVQSASQENNKPLMVGDMDPSGE